MIKRIGTILALLTLMGVMGATALPTSRVAITSSVLKGDSNGNAVAATSGTDYIAAPSSICQGRLTLETGVPVSTTDQIGKSTVYFTPYNGNGISLYTGSAWKLYTFTERSLTLSGLTSGKNYDVFLYDNAGTLTLALSNAWTNDTTRADSLVAQDGVFCLSGTLGKRWLGTIRATGATTTEDSGGKRFVWNRYHQVPRSMQVVDAASGWSYTTATIRQANNAVGNKVEYVTGDAGVLVDARACGAALLANNSGFAAVGVGVDSITGFSGLTQPADSPTTSSIVAPVTGKYAGTPGLGYHYLSWNEQGGVGGAGVTCFFFGSNGGIQSGLVANILN